jgi:hypothetical protein
MTTGTDNFVGETPGAGVPTDWATSLWVHTGKTYTITTDADSSGGISLRQQSNSTTGLHSLVSDTLAGSFANGELLGDFEIIDTTLPTAASPVRLIFRASGTTSFTGLAASIRPENATATLYVAWYEAGVLQTIPGGAGSNTPVIDYAQRQFIRVNFNGTTIKVSWWQGTLQDDPGTWLINHTWTALTRTGAGAVGFGMNATDADVYVHRLAWSNDPAVSAAFAGIQLSSHTATSITDTTATVGITSNDSYGTLYWFLSTSLTPPSETNLKAGTGAALGKYGNDATPTIGANTTALTGLSPATTYYLHWFQQGTVDKSAIATSSGFTTSAGVGEDPALRLDAAGGSSEVLDTDTGIAVTAADAKYIVLGLTGSPQVYEIVKQGLVDVVSGAVDDITDASSPLLLSNVGATYKVAVIVGEGIQGVYDATIVDRNA